METTNSTKWLQVKGDPAIRRHVFSQSRVESLFDQRVDELLHICEQLLSVYGVFHLRIHFSSNQLTCWTYENPYNYQVFVGEDIFNPEFYDYFATSKCTLPTIISPQEVRAILHEFKNLRFLDEKIYLRNGSINRVNGMVALSFSCDGTHYLTSEEFFETYDFFG